MQKTVSNVREVRFGLPSDGGYAWVIVAASFMINFVIDGIIYSFGKTKNVLFDENIATEEQISIIGSLHMLLYYLLGPVTSAFLNRFGFRIVVFSGAVITCVGILVASFLTSYVGLVLCYGILGGIGFGIMFPPTIIIIGYNFEKYRAISTGIGLSGSSIGVLCLTPLFNEVTTKYGWHMTMRIQSACLAICMICSMAYRPLKLKRLTESNSNKARSSLGSHEKLMQLYENTDQATTENADKVPIENSENILPKKESIIPLRVSIESLRSYRSIEVIRNKEKKKFCGCFEHCKCASDESDNVLTTGPLDRKDIFYSASLAQLPEYTADKTKNRNEAKNDQDLVGMQLSYHLSMIQDSIASYALPTGSHGRCRMIKNALRLLFDVSILKSVAFCTFAMAQFFYVLSLYIPYMFIKDRADGYSIPHNYSDWFVPAISIGNFIGRVSSGVIGSLLSNVVHPCYLIGFSTIFAGTITIIASFVSQGDQYFQLSYCALLGFTIAFNVTLRPIVIVYLLGLEKLTNGFGLNMMTMGFSGLIALPIATIIKSATDDYTYVFVLAGVSYVTSGILIISALHIHKQKQRKN